MTTGKNSFRFPHPLTLLIGCILLASALTYILPSGQYQRQQDVQTGREIVTPGSYHRVAPNPVSVWDALVAIPAGMAEAADVIFFVFLTGAAFIVVDETGALRHAVDWLVQKLANRDILVICIASILFATGGVLTNMQEEFIALAPVLLLLTGRLGFNPLTAIAISAGAAAVGASFSPINPFQVGFAQNLAEVPLLSGALFRIVFLLLALGVWIAGTVRYARKTRKPVDRQAVVASGPFSLQHRIVLLLLFASFGMFVYGVLGLDWGFNEMNALFFLMGILVGLLGGLGIAGTARAFVKGFEAMAFSALLIGFAQAIFVVLRQGLVVDTIVNSLFAPLENLPLALSAAGMMAVQTVIHVPVPSVSGQAALTLPVLIPLSDLLGLSRQVTVLAFQYGAGLCELLTPTNGALMATLAVAGVRYDQWLKFAFPLFLLLFIVGIAAIITGIVLGLK
jgi:uncharacterized ion transporter superfamily protein YfcC